MAAMSDDRSRRTRRHKASQFILSRQTANMLRVSTMFENVVVLALLGRGVWDAPFAAGLKLFLNPIFSNQQKPPGLCL